MRIVLALILCLMPSSLLAQETWILTVDRWGNAEQMEATFTRRGSSLEGRLGGWAMTGRIDGRRITFAADDGRGSAYRFTGSASGDSMHGSADFPDTNDPQARAAHPFTGWRVPDRPASARRIAFEPRTFSNEFTALRHPVLVLWPGDTVSTRTLDSGGADRDGRTRAMYGNPQTGPFFVATARPGDVLAIHILRLRTNRGWAESLDGFASRAMGPGLATRSTNLGKRVRWRIDAERGVATIEDAAGALADYAVPLRPMLGGIGVAPDFGFAPMSGGDSGRFGGNMDSNEVVEGTTVYLPVFRPGALLYLGDGHAAQGDGETTQWALETSLDVEFTVDVLPSKPLAAPRVESPTHLTVIGQGASMDDAMRAATAALAQWLEQDYALTLSEASLVIGSAGEFRVVTVAGRNAGIAGRIPKSLLSRLRR